MTILVDAIAPQAVDGTIYLAQLSDPHLLRDQDATFLGVNPWESYLAVVDQIGQESGLDVVLVSGDISQDHTAGAYHNFIDGIEPLGLPTYTIPGNHDIPELMVDCLIGSDVKYGRRLLLGDWQLLMLDSTIFGVPAGHLSLSELSWLHGVLNSSDRPTIIALHHHVKPTGCQWLDQHSLDNGIEFLDLISRFSHVKAVIWGHVHQEMDLWHKHIRLLAVPSTSIQFLPDSDDFILDSLQPGYRLLALKADGSIETQIQRVGGNRFIADPAAKGY